MLPLKDNVPTRSAPVVTVGLIVANALVWLWEIRGTSVNEDIAHYAYYPCTLVHTCVSQIVPPDRLPWYEGAFSSMFMHGSWGHVAFNMLFLWIFGNNVEDAMGKVRFLVFYLAAGLAATALQTAVTIATQGPAGESIPNVGASGAIAGVLGAYFLLLPRARVLVLVFFFLREIPAWLMLGAWIAFQLWDGNFQLAHPEGGGGVAFFAHIGGFLFGMATVHALIVRRPLRPRY